jgi:hypothetical protein
VLAVRRRGGPFLAAARSILIQPRVFFGAAGMAILVGVALLLTARSGSSGLHRADWILLIVLAAIAVGSAAAGVITRSTRSGHS